MTMAREQQAAVIREAAIQIGTRPEWLDALINFETAGTYDTSISNTLSSAKGLIQFTNASARDLGYADSTDLVRALPDFESQMMNGVVPYFRLKARQNNITSYQDKQALYMAVFYPVYWNKPPGTPFPDSVQAVNPGIVTAQDYINFVDGRIRAEALRVPPTLPILAILAGVGVIGWIFLRSRKG